MRFEWLHQLQDEADSVRPISQLAHELGIPLQKSPDRIASLKQQGTSAESFRALNLKFYGTIPQ